MMERDDPTVSPIRNQLHQTLKQEANGSALVGVHGGPGIGTGLFSFFFFLDPAPEPLMRRWNRNRI